DRSRFPDDEARRRRKHILGESRGHLRGGLPADAAIEDGDRLLGMVAAQRRFEEIRIGDFGPKPGGRGAADDDDRYRTIGLEVRGESRQARLVLDDLARHRAMRGFGGGALRRRQHDSEKPDRDHEKAHRVTPKAWPGWRTVAAPDGATPA